MDKWPLYECHKIVRAAKIASLGPKGADGAVEAVLVDPDEDGVLEAFCPSEPVMAAKAKIGDYAVVYSDGYKSVCPKAAFEVGYSLLSGDPDRVTPKEHQTP